MIKEKIVIAIGLAVVLALAILVALQPTIPPITPENAHIRKDTAKSRHAKDVEPTENPMFKDGYFVPQLQVGDTFSIIANSYNGVPQRETETWVKTASGFKKIKVQQ